VRSVVAPRAARVSAAWLGPGIDSRPLGVHDAARGFEVAAGAYERGRPEYPHPAVDLVARALPLGPGTRLLDLGAGTGKLSRLVAARGARVVALDPAHALLRLVAGTAGVGRCARSPGAPFRAGALDAVTAASSFHWFDGALALAEIHRVLRAGGRLALLWNRRDDSVAWVARLSAIVNSREGGAPRYHRGDWRRAFHDAPGLFSPVEEAHFAHVHPLTRSGVLDRVASISFVARMGGAAREEVLVEVRALLDSHPETAGRDELDFPYVTDVHLYERA
jgi:SAM-dependent methyltransferase